MAVASQDIGRWASQVSANSPSAIPFQSPTPARRSQSRPSQGPEAEQDEDDILPIDPPNRKRPSASRDPDDLLPTSLQNAMSTILPAGHHLKRKKTIKAEAIDVSSDEEVLADGKVKLSDKKRDWLEQEGGRIKRWGGIRLNGTHYRVDDSVEIRIGHAKTVIGLIRSIHETDSGPQGRRKVYFHLQWLGPFDATLRWNDASVKELFLTDAHCDDVSISRIIRKLDVVHLKLGQAVPNSSNRRFCRFVVTADHRIRDPVDSNKDHGCDACERKSQLSTKCIVSRNSITLPGDKIIHTNDTILIDPLHTGHPYLVGQIVTFLTDTQTVRVRMLKRRSELSVDDFQDDRHLYLTDDVDEFAAVRVRGQCHVVDNKDQSSARNEDPTFWCDERFSTSQNRLVPLQRSLPCCEQCEAARMETLRLNKRFSALVKSLRVADYYSGGGGGILSARKYFKVVSAVEMNPVACSTISRNNSKITICCATVSDLLRRERQYANGGVVDEMYVSRDIDRPASRRGKIPRLPEKGSILLMMGGVPCQGHSRANAHQQADDQRNSELYVFLAEIERVQPGYVVIENVPGFKDERNDGSFNEEAGVKNYAAAAQNLLVQLDYQCQLAILDARSFGSAQNRSRLWIIGAKRGLPLPQIPHPTHANPKVRATVFSRTGAQATSTYAEVGTPGCGAYPAVTVVDAIGDLPRFDFQLPGKPARPGVSTLPAGSAGMRTDTRVGFDGPTPYRTGPQTLFQKRMRGKEIEVTDHFTPSRAPSEVEKCHAAFEPLLGNDLKGSEKRLEANGGFKALLTNNAPGQRASRPIHYDQRRSKTVAEDKRAMGFPDGYKLSGTAKGQIAQLGNAWCVHMGKAIVGSIHRAIRDEWIEDGQPEDLETWWTRKSGRLTKTET